MKTALTILLAAAFAVCGCENKDTSSPNPQKDSGTPTTKYKIDGMMDDWSKATPVLTEAGKAGTKFEYEPDVKKVFMDNDENFLYMFLQCSPPPEERHKYESNTVGIATLFIDKDNNEATGSKQARILFLDENKDGLDIQVEIKTIVEMGETPEDGPVNVYNTCWQLADWSDDKNDFVNADGKSAKGSSTETPDLIADGKDGVELRIPLNEIGIKPGDTIRVLLKENANSGSKEGFNEFKFTLKK